MSSLTMSYFLYYRKETDAHLGSLVATAHSHEQTLLLPGLWFGIRGARMSMFVSRKSIGHRPHRIERSTHLSACSKEEGH